MQDIIDLLDKINVTLSQKNKKRNSSLLLKLAKNKKKLPSGIFDLIHSLSVLVFDTSFVNFKNYINLIYKTKPPFYFIEALHNVAYSHREFFSLDSFKFFLTEFLEIYKSRDEIRREIKSLLLSSLFLSHKNKYYREYFSILILPIFKDETKSDINSALSIEAFFYINFIKQSESEDYFSYFYSQINNVYENINYSDVHCMNQVIPAYNLRATGKKRILFIINNAVQLAHVEVLFSLLKGWKNIAVCEYEPIVIFLFGRDRDIDIFLSKNNIETIFLSDIFANDSLIYERFIFIKELNSRHNILFSIILSNVVWMSCIFSIRISKNQIWYSMKFHSYNSKNIDLYLTGGAEGEIYKDINSTKWSIVQGGLINLFDPSLSSQASSIKDSLKNWGSILGCFAREEKLRNLDYLNLISTILKRNKDSIFLWTGKEEDVFISTFFKEKQISDQTLFLGWINTKLYAQVIDIYLDCFPVPSGLTIYQAMAASVPFVTHHLDNENQGIQANANNLYSNNNLSLEKDNIFFDVQYGNLYLLAKNDFQYIEYCEKLIHDKSFREKVGLASRKFIDKHMSDETKFAHTFFYHINKMPQK